MEITRRDWVILIAFTLLLAGGVGIVFLKANGGPKRDVAELPPSRPAGDGTQPQLTIDENPNPAERDGIMTSSLAPGEVPPDYEAIVQRNLFTPLVKATSKGQPSPTQIAPLPVPSIATGSQSEVKSQQKPTESTNDAKPADNPPSTASTPATPPKPPLAVTGLVRAGDGYRVIVENTELKRSQVARVGQDVFGYRITEVSAETGEVVIGKPDSVGNSDVTLKLGENKKVETEQAAQPAASTSTSSSSDGDRARSSSGSSSSSSSSWGRGPGGFDPSQLTPEQRARFEEYRRRRGDRGGGFGGDRGGR